MNPMYAKELAEVETYPLLEPFIETCSSHLLELGKESEIVLDEMLIRPLTHKNLATYMEEPKTLLLLNRENNAALEDWS